MAAETLESRLLGDFALRQDGRLVAGLNSSRLQALLAYLLLHRDAPQLRHYLAFLFWPDTSEAQARANLRNLLHRLQFLQMCAQLESRQTRFRHSAQGVAYARAACQLAEQTEDAQVIHSTRFGLGFMLLWQVELFTLLTPRRFDLCGLCVLA